jgi:hypothetical protein
MSGFSFDEHLVAPHTAACLAHDGLCEHDERLSEMIATAEYNGRDVNEVAEVVLPRGQWLLLTSEIDVAAFALTTRDEECRPMADDEATPGCTCPGCDAFTTYASGKLIDLMRLSIVVEDTSWGRGPELATAYEDFWPSIAIAMGEQL